METDAGPTVRIMLASQVPAPYAGIARTVETDAGQPVIIMVASRVPPPHGRIIDLTVEIKLEAVHHVLKGRTDTNDN